MNKEIEKLVDIKSQLALAINDFLTDKSNTGRVFKAWDMDIEVSDTSTRIVMSAKESNEGLSIAFNYHTGKYEVYSKDQTRLIYEPEDLYMFIDCSTLDTIVSVFLERLSNKVGLSNLYTDTATVLNILTTEYVTNESKRTEYIDKIRGEQHEYEGYYVI